MLQAHSDLNLIVGSDQGIEGAVQAIGKKKVILVGYGGSAAALQGVAAGKWYGDVAQLPASEGRLAAQAVIKAVRTGAKAGGVNPVADLPNQGVVTKENADQFTAEWPG
jgi:ribose transport system substrate-binding protein